MAAAWQARPDSARNFPALALGIAPGPSADAPGAAPGGRVRARHFAQERGNRTAPRRIQWENGTGVPRAGVGTALEET